MNKDVVEVRLRAVLPLEGSFAVFLAAPEKTMVIYIDDAVGTAISLFMRGVAKERPLTHDLMGSLLLAFGARLQRVVINDIDGSVFRARLIIDAENQLHARKVIELDARPSDGIAMALQQEAPIYVARKVLEEVRDERELLRKIEQRDLDAMMAAEAAEEEAELAAAGDDDDDFSDLDEMDDEDDDDDDDEDFFDEDDDSDEEGEEWKRADD